jgi:hypothetical protein
MANPKEEKAKIHRWIRLGVAVMESTRTFREDFTEYARRVNDPSLLAMSGNQAESLLEAFRWPSDVGEMLFSRVMISKQQGEYSLQRKRELQAMRTGT